MQGSILGATPVKSIHTPIDARVQKTVFRPTSTEVVHDPTEFVVQGLFSMQLLSKEFVRTYRVRPWRENTGSLMILLCGYQSIARATVEYFSS